MKYCFDVEETIPFLAFRGLRSIAERNVGEVNILDLSQGEPGYGFSPNVRSRRFFGFLAMLDIAFNDHNKDTLFFQRRASELTEIEKVVEETAKKNYATVVAKELIADWAEFITELEKICDAQNLGYDRFKIYYELFKYSNLMGGRYPQPAGHPLLQATMAEEYSENIGVKVKAHELIGIMGASHGIGATFKALGEEGVCFLKKGDYVAMTSPVYAPYNTLFEERGIKVLSIPVDPVTGEIDPEDIKALQDKKRRIKAVVLIDPNNPTGFASSDAFLSNVIELAEFHNSLIISDGVYLRFFDDTRVVSHYPQARKRLILIDSLSKIERATGVRAGDIYVSDEANEYISNEILYDFIPEKYQNIRHLLFLAKSPGGQNMGLFQHITGIPGPSVGISLSHVILGKKERREYVLMLREKVKVFYETLGLPQQGNSYYGMIDLMDLAGKETKERAVELTMEKIAEKGVVVMPANLFFSESDRKKKSRKSVIRVSLPNLSLENTKKAASIIKEIATQ
jgi:aspartate/methionine/tyrosine aminotransferase